MLFCVSPRNCTRSGDCVALESCGEIIDGGRLDTQVKVRGYRMDPYDTLSLSLVCQVFHRQLFRRTIPMQRNLHYGYNFVVRHKTAFSRELKGLALNALSV